MNEPCNNSSSDYELKCKSCAYNYKLEKDWKPYVKREIEKNYIIVDVSEEPKGFARLSIDGMKPNEENMWNSIHEADDAILDAISSGLIKNDNLWIAAPYLNNQADWMKKNVNIVSNDSSNGECIPNFYGHQSEDGKAIYNDKRGEFKSPKGEKWGRGEDDQYSGTSVLRDIFVRDMMNGNNNPAKNECGSPDQDTISINPNMGAQLQRVTRKKYVDSGYKPVSTIGYSGTSLNSDGSPEETKRHIWILKKVIKSNL